VIVEQRQLSAQNSCNRMNSDRPRHLMATATPFGRLVERHQSAICATIRGLLPRYSEWEDLAQEVFVRLFKHLQTFDAREFVSNLDSGNCPESVPECASSAVR